MPRHELLASLSAVLFLLGAPAVFAADPKPIATVGNQTVSADDLSRRLAKIPDFQRAALGDTPQKLKRQVLETLIVPDLLFAAEAHRLNIDDRPSLHQRERELLRQAMDRELRVESRAETPVTADDIKAYFEANRTRFETPRRIRLWRILTDDEALARKVIADSQGVDGLKHWSQYAREKSLDKATQLRDGDLGFVHPDGKTDAPTLRVDPSLFAQAEPLLDGQIGKEPIKEGSHFAVIWRRGSASAIVRTLAQEEGSIRQVLERERLEQARQKLIDRLTGKYVTEVNEPLLETLHFDSSTLPVRDHSGRDPRVPAAGSALPSPSERGSR